MMSSLHTTANSDHLPLHEFRAVFHLLA